MHRVTTGCHQLYTEMQFSGKNYSQQPIKTAMKGSTILNQEKFGCFPVVHIHQTDFIGGKGQSLNCKQEGFKAGDKEAEPAAGKKRSCTGSKVPETSQFAVNVGHTNRPSSVCPNLIWAPNLLKYYYYWRSLTRTHLCDLEESEFDKISI